MLVTASYRSLRRAILALLALAALLGPAAPAGAYTSRVGSDFAGVNGGYVFANLPSSSWPQVFSTMAAAGVRDVRTDAPWGLLEPNAPVNGVHTYDLTAGDPGIAALARAGLRWFPVIDYSASWAASVPGNVYSPPAKDADYAAYAQALVKRYGPGGAFWKANPQLPYLPVNTWEIWNEENGAGAWAPAPNAAQYTNLYLAARQAIKAVDPGATVLVGGLLPQTANSFVTQMFASHPGLAGQVDAFALHPYAPTASGTLSSIASFRQTLIADGDPNVPIDVTEVGWSTASWWFWPTTETNRAAYFTNVTNAVATSNCNVARFIPYTWTDNDGDGDFGLYSAGGVPTPSGTAYTTAILNLEGRGSGPPPSSTDPVCPAPPSPVAAKPPAGKGSTAQIASAARAEPAHTKHKKKKKKKKHKKRKRAKKAHKR